MPILRLGHLKPQMLRKHQARSGETQKPKENELERHLLPSLRRVGRLSAQEYPKDVTGSTRPYGFWLSSKSKTKASLAGSKEPFLFFGTQDLKKCKKSIENLWLTFQQSLFAKCRQQLSGSLRAALSRPEVMLMSLEYRFTFINVLEESWEAAESWKDFWFVLFFIGLYL